MDKSRKIGTAVVASAVAAALMLCIPSALTASAEDEPFSAPLTPIEATGDIAYKYLDMPSSVHADPSGIHVACADGVVSVTVEQENGLSFSEPKDISADKAYKHGECFIALNDGTIYSHYGIDTEPTEYSALDFVDFDVCGDTLYAVGKDSLAIVPIVNDALDVSEAVQVAFSAPSYKDINVSAIAATENNVFVALTSYTAPYKQDIASVDTKSGALSPVLFQSDNIMALTVMAHNDTVYALTRDKITGYSAASGALKQKYVSDDARMKDIFACDGYIYAMDTLGALYRISSDLKTYTVLSACASDADGFFNSPAGAAVKNSTLYVADSVNNRIALYGDEISYVYDNYNFPVSVACDSRGTLYVAHDYNKVSFGNVEFTVDGFIKQITVDADKQIYVLSDVGLWTFDNDTASAVKISDTQYKSIALGIGRDELFALGYENVDKIDSDENGDYTAENYCAAPASAYSLAVDFKGNVYLLSSDRITRVDKESAESSADIALTLDGEKYSVDGGQILLSTVGNDYVEYGSAIIVDTYKHRVFSADGSAQVLNIKLIDSDDYDVPDLAGDKTPEYYGDGLIRTALYDVPVFSLPIETPEVYLIKKGRNVIVPEYELEDTHEFSLILIDDTSSHKLIQGYVYKDALSDPLEYTAPPANAVAPYSGATPIYKWPSPHSKTVEGYSPATSGDTIMTLDFVKSFTDYKGNLWYRVKIDDCEGFMMAADVNLGEYEITRIRPAYNAKIISHNGSKYAQAYVLRNGVYSAIDIKLDTGTKVEVVGAFDTSEYYTKIKCLTELGTVTCYVRTVYIEYEGVNIVLLVAIVVIIITVVLAAVIIGRVMYLKKKRLTSPEDDENARE